MNAPKTLQKLLGTGLLATSLLLGGCDNQAQKVQRAENLATEAGLSISQFRQVSNGIINRNNDNHTAASYAFYAEEAVKRKVSFDQAVILTKLDLQSYVVKEYSNGLDEYKRGFFDYPGSVALASVAVGITTPSEPIAKALAQKDGIVSSPNSSPFDYLNNACEAFVAKYEAPKEPTFEGPER